MYEEICVGATNDKKIIEYLSRLYFKKLKFNPVLDSLF